MPLFGCLIIYVKGLPLQIHVRHGTTFPPTPAHIPPPRNPAPHSFFVPLPVGGGGGGGGVVAHPPDPNPLPPQTQTQKSVDGG
jgi:hypothetical protein